MKKVIQMLKELLKKNIFKIGFFGVGFLLLALMVGFRFSLSLLTVAGIYLFFDYSSKNPMLDFKNKKNDDVEEKEKKELKK